MAQRIAPFNAQGIQVELLVMDCANCGVVYAITKQLERRRRDDGRHWWCPNGHHQIFRDNELDRQRRRAEQAEAKATRLQQSLDEEAREHRETEAMRRRLLKRIRAGVCPHCKRHFKGLAAHVETKHPDEPLGAVLETQPVIHKRRYRDINEGTGNTTACWRHVRAGRAAYRWEQVTCRQCLRHAG